MNHQLYVPQNIGIFIAIVFNLNWCGNFDFLRYSLTIPSHHPNSICCSLKIPFHTSLSAYDFVSYNLEKKRSHTGLPHLPLPNLPAHLHIAFCLLKEFILRPDLPIVLLIPSSLTTQRNWSWNYLFSSGSSPSLLEHLP